MQALIDWVSFTVKQYEGKKVTAKSVIEDVLGLSFEMFQPMTGGYGYRKQYVHNNVKAIITITQMYHVDIKSETISFISI